MASMFDIGGRRVGPGAPCYVIAEAGVNHNGDLTLAKRLIDVAIDAGADAVKFQTFRTSALVTASAPKAAYQQRQTGGDEGQHDMLSRLELSRDMHVELMAYCERGGIQFLSTPFEEQSADLLFALQVAAFKIPSGEVTNLPFLGHLARMGRPLILSTGMATLEEVEGALEVIRAAGSGPVALLHCVSSYPTEAGDANLRAMSTMAAAFDVPVGYSDHTEGIDIPMAAVALGACIIEKHITLDRSLPGPDQQASVEPSELAAMIRGIRRVEAALGHGRKVPAPSERNTAAVARKSLVSARDIEEGTPITVDALVMKRPGTGLPPGSLPHVLGRSARRRIPRDTLLKWDDLA